jgi:hypothetical protein
VEVNGRTPSYGLVGVFDGEFGRQEPRREARTPGAPRRRRPPLHAGLVKVLVHLLTAGNYGYFRDEPYYVAASEHLSLGYVDFPTVRSPHDRRGAGHAGRLAAGARF